MTKQDHERGSEATGIYLSVCVLTAKGRNEEMKTALGITQLRYPTMHHGASKMFGMGEL